MSDKILALTASLAIALGGLAPAQAADMFELMNPMWWMFGDDDDDDDWYRYGYGPYGWGGPYGYGHPGYANRTQTVIVIPPDEDVAEATRAPE